MHNWPIRWYSFGRFSGLNLPLLQKIEVEFCLRECPSLLMHLFLSCHTYINIVTFILPAFAVCFRMLFPSLFIVHTNNVFLTNQ